MTQWIRGLVCRVVGHWWGWPELYFVVEGCRGGAVVRLCRVWRQCDRCGCREADEARGTSCAVLPSFQGPVVGLGGRGEVDRLGEKVKRAMGWGEG